MIKENSNNNMHGTTILAVRRKNNVVIAGDGQVSLGYTIMKSNNSTSYYIRLHHHSSTQIRDSWLGPGSQDPGPQMYRICHTGSIM